jgi:hypothetical protein
MQVTQRPTPFTPGLGYLVKVAGGTPPYQILPAPSPPNPPGVTVNQTTANSAEVDAPTSTPPNTQIYVEVRDSSQPPNTTTIVNTTA